MDDRKELTKNLIASGVKELVLTQSFEKITIRMIAEKAGIIRPTFYYHFQDKYEVLEWIVRSQLLEPIKVMLNRGLFDESLKFIFVTIEAEREFYRKAFEISGQNSFWEIMITCIKEFLLNDTSIAEPKKIANAPDTITPEFVALHLAFDLSAMIHIWLRKMPDVSADEIAATYKYLNGAPLYRLLESYFGN